MTPLNEYTINAAMAALRERITELESTIAAQHDLLEERGEALERAQDRIAELEAMIFIEHDDRPEDFIQPESRPFGSHYEYVEGCRP